VTDKTEAQLVDALKELVAAYARTIVDRYMAEEHPGVTMTEFECPACDHQWEGVARRSHAWETCPSCGADDGENCWDCGKTSEHEEMDMCTNCRHTICEECDHPHSHDPRGRVSDGGECGHTTRVI
jgi:hypothetical protein